MENKYDGIFDTIEDAITVYLMKKGLNKMQLWKFGINVFELSLFCEEYIKNNFENKQKLYKEILGNTSSTNNARTPLLEIGNTGSNPVTRDNSLVSSSGNVQISTLSEQGETNGK